MALTRAHHDGREQFTREDIVEAMTTVESGTAVSVEYVPEETRAVAIHEAGHAACRARLPARAPSRRGSRSACAPARSATTRRSRRRSASAPGSTRRWRSSPGRSARMAAEHVFYGENATGVGGDLQSATGRAAWMVGVSGMGPDRDRAERRPHERGAPGGARADRQALRGDRPPADEPGERRLPARLDRRRPAATRPSARSPRRSSARRT